MYCNYNHPQQIKDVVQSVEEEDIESLRFYLADGADPDMRDEHGLGLLHIAAREGKTAAAETLLEFGADPDLKVGITQHTPLFYAARTESAAMVQLLTHAHAKIDAVDGYGWTPLHMAADHGAYEALKELVSAGADVAAKDRDGATARDHAQRRYDATRQADHWLCAEHLRQAEAALDVEGQRREHVTRDIETLKRHNPKQFRLKF